MHRLRTVAAALRLGLKTTGPARGLHLRATQHAEASNGFQISLIPCLSDNYAYLLHKPSSGVTAVVDPAEAGPVKEALAARGLGLDYILNTHHHMDHVGGNLELKDEFGAQIVGPKEDQKRIPGIDIALAEGDDWSMGGESVQTFHTPGHTKGHCAFYLPESNAVFTGDTLFSLGCGRLFEGTAEQMYDSLQKLASLDDATLVFCGHEYTQSNAKFAASIDANNSDLKKRCEEINSLRSSGMPTIPTTIGLEKATNPFLRSGDAAILKNLGVDGSNAVEAFAAIRTAKDNF